jgi:hypothetical protein
MSFSGESSHEQGPLDALRQCLGAVGALDRELAELDPETSADRRREIIDAIHDLYNFLPLINQEVFAMGTVVEAATLETLPASESNDAKMGVVTPRLVYSSTEGPDEPLDFSTNILKGFLRGFMVMPVFDGEKERARILLALETGREVFQSFTFQDVNVVTYSWVCADDASILPVEPLNCHSISDLESSGLMGPIQEIIGRQDKPTPNKLKEIGEYINYLYTRSNVDPRLNQLVSYINSVLRIQGYFAFTSELIEGSPVVNQNLYEFTVGSRDRKAGCYAASHLVTLDAYERTGDGPSDFRVMDYRQLYVKARNGSGRYVTIPLNQIEEFATMPVS